MEKLGYVVLAGALIAWLAVVVIDLVPIFPDGTIGLVSLVGLGLLFAKAFKDRVLSAKDDKYSKNVKR